MDERTWILRMRWVVTFIASTGCIALSVLALLWAMDVLPSQSITLYTGTFTWAWLSTDFAARTAFIAVSLGVLSLGVLGWVLCLMPARPRHKHFVIHRTKGFQTYGGSQVMLSNKGLHALTRYVLDQVDGVMQSEPRIALKPKGWSIECRVYVWHGSAMPDLVQRITTQVHHVLEQHTGIPVEKVDVIAEYQSWQHGGAPL